MTRDENEGDLTDVIETLISYARNSRVAAYNEGLEAGKAMLKLDEPKSVEDRAVDVLKNYAPAPSHVIHDLAVAGLKIVEK